jgi:hypothetical protein
VPRDANRDAMFVSHWIRPRANSIALANTSSNAPTGAPVILSRWCVYTPI